MRHSALRLGFVIWASVLLTSCARAPDLIGVDNLDRPVALAQDAKKRKVFIATTREASAAVGVFYSAERSPDLGLASVVVSVPPTHVRGQLERPKRLPPDPKTDFAIIEPTVYGGGDIFVSRINRELDKLAPKDRKVLLFVHGYNNTLSDAILRMTQFVEDTNYRGVPVLFSWASGGQAKLYVYDVNSVLAARPRFLETARLLGRTKASGFDVFAHSMGAMLTVEAFLQASLSNGFNPDQRLQNVMLASPDIDVDLFRSQLEIQGDVDSNFFVFTSRDDAALGFSRLISGGVERVGAADAETLAEFGVTVIDLSEIDDSASGSHSKFAGSPDVVRLIGRSLQSDHFRNPPNQPTLVEVLDGVPVLRDLVE